MGRCGRLRFRFSGKSARGLAHSKTLTRISELKSGRKRMGGSAVTLYFAYLRLITLGWGGERIARMENRESRMEDGRKDDKKASGRTNRSPLLGVARRCSPFCRRGEADKKIGRSALVAISPHWSAFSAGEALAKLQTGNFGVFEVSKVASGRKAMGSGKRTAGKVVRSCGNLVRRLCDFKGFLAGNSWKGS
jgi:hypothetical protein